MIITVCAGKGSPGVTTVATALAVAWPGERVLLEADPAGGDLAFRLSRPRAAGCWRGSRACWRRRPMPANGCRRMRWPATPRTPAWGCRWCLGACRQQAFAPMARLWPQVAAQAARWPGTVIADLGRLQAGNAAGAGRGGVGAVLLVTRADVPGALYHARDRAGGAGGQARGPTARRRQPAGGRGGVPERAADRAVGGAGRCSPRTSATSTVPVAGYLAHDPRRGAGAARRGAGASAVGHRTDALGQGPGHDAVGLVPGA